MKKSRLVYSLLAILFGVFMVIYGGYDDSPGAQFLGLVLVILGVLGITKMRKKSTQKFSYERDSNTA